MECPNEINGMIDAAKFADLALLLIDGSYGFEMVRSCRHMIYLLHLTIKKFQPTSVLLKGRMKSWLITLFFVFGNYSLIFCCGFMLRELVCFGQVNLFDSQNDAPPHL